MIVAAYLALLFGLVSVGVGAGLAMDAFQRSIGFAAELTKSRARAATLAAVGLALLGVVLIALGASAIVSSS